MLSEIRQWAVRFYRNLYLLLYGSKYEEDEEMSTSFYVGLPKLQEAVLERAFCECNGMQCAKSAWY